MFNVDFMEARREILGGQGKKINNQWDSQILIDVKSGVQHDLQHFQQNVRVQEDIDFCIDIFGKRNEASRRNRTRCGRNPQQAFTMYLFLWIKNQENKYEAKLLKCPDKNATLTFTLKAQALEEIRLDTISDSSFKNLELEQIVNSSLNKPVTSSVTVNSVSNFKKKQRSEEVGSGFPNQSSSLSSKILKSDIMIKENTTNQVYQQKARGLQDMNRKLKDELKNIKKQNQSLNKIYELNMEELEEYKKKTEEFQSLINKLKSSLKSAKSLQKQNKGLENELLTGRHKLANIFNAAFQIGGAQLTDQLQQASGYVQNR